jgi:hypothetical protein
MSIRVMTQVWDDFPGGGSELLTMLALADWSDDAGKCYPAISSIAKKIRLKERQAQRVVHQLIANGFVKVIGNEFGGAPGASRQYRLNLSCLTGVTHDTPVSQTGVMEDADGCHPRRLTGVTHDTLTVIEPSITVKKVSSRKNHSISLKQFLEDCKANREKTFPENDPVFEYADTVGIDQEMIATCWQEFKAAYLPGKKTYADWRSHFRNAVRRNWYKLWYLKAGEVAQWTSAGEQARRAAA